MTTTLRHGDRSQAVRALQKNLNSNGAKLVLDGDYRRINHPSESRLRTPDWRKAEVHRNEMA